MNKEELRKQLAQAEHDVSEGEGILAQQREVVSRLAALGGDVDTARKVLAEFERSQTLSIADRDRLRVLLTGLRIPGLLSS